jgi:hypothetical protein
MRVLASVRVLPHHDLGAAGGGHQDPSDDPRFMLRFVNLVDGEHRKDHFPDMCDPHKPQKPCLLSPDHGSTSRPATSPVQPLPDVHTISGLQQALKMLGCCIAVDGDYGPETRQVVTSFQMHAGIVANVIAGNGRKATW